jgi:hypothetical protein
MQDPNSESQHVNTSELANQEMNQENEGEKQEVIYYINK